MPTYLNPNFIFSINYTSTQPAATATYTDTNGTVYTIQVVGTGVYAGKYAVTGSTPPAMAPTVQFVSPQSPLTGTAPSSPTGYQNTSVTLTKTSGTGDATVTLTGYTYSSVYTSGSNRIESGQSLLTNSYFLNAPWYIFESSVNPFYDNIIYSSQITSTTTFSIPTTMIDSSTGNPVPLVGNYLIKIYMTSGTGSCLVQLNSASAQSRYVGLYEHYDVACRGRAVNSVIITISGTVAVNFTIEKM